MEKRIIYGFCFLLGGGFLLIFVGNLLIDLLSKIIFYFMLIFFIVLMLYGVILILIGILIISVSKIIKKSVALIIFSIGILIVLLSITVIIIDSFTSVNVFEIFSGIGFIYLGIRLFFQKKKLKTEKKTKPEKKILEVVLFIMGLIISVYYGFLAIMTTVTFEPAYLLYQLALILPPFLLGIMLLVYSIYSIRVTHTTPEKKNKVVLPILRGIIIVLIVLSILFTILFTRIVLTF